MGNIIDGNKENIKVLSTAITTIAENQAKAFEKKSETDDKRLTLQENKHKSQLELSHDKFAFEKEKATDNRMKACVKMLNDLRKEALKSMIEADDEDAREVLKKECVQKAKKCKQAFDAQIS